MSKVQRPAVFAAIIAAAAVFGQPAFAQDKVIAKIDGQPVTEQELALVMQSMAQQTAQLPEPAKKKAAFDRLIDMKIIAGQAAKDGLDKSDEFKRRLEAIRQQLLINEYVKVKVDGAVTDSRTTEGPYGIAVCQG